MADTSSTGEAGVYGWLHGVGGVEDFETAHRSFSGENLIWSRPELLTWRTSSPIRFQIRLRLGLRSSGAFGLLAAQRSSSGIEGRLRNLDVGQPAAHRQRRGLDRANDFEIFGCRCPILVGGGLPLGSNGPKIKAGFRPRK